MESPGSLQIRNYKCFSDLRLETVGTVNLIAGKNNVGKSTLLEAVALAASGGNPKELFRILDRREGPGDEAALVRLFREQFPGQPCKISLGNILKIECPAGHPAEGLEPVWKEFRRDAKSSLIPSFSIEYGTRGFAFDLTMETRQAAYAGVFDSDPAVKQTMRKLRSNLELQSNPAKIRALWDEIQARPGEDLLVEVMQLIDPRVKRITLPFTPESPTPRLRFGDEAELVPITRLGDGMKRLFEIGLALVNAKDGILLLDEIENGIHYSVFPRLWELLFEVACRLNVTIFATTHDHDAAASFSQVAFRRKALLGVLTRLDQRKSGVVAVQYTEEEAFVAAEEGIEVR